MAAIFFRVKFHCSNFAQSLFLQPILWGLIAARRLITITLYTFTLPQSDGCRSVLFWSQHCRGEVRYHHARHVFFFFLTKGGRGEGVAKPEVITAEKVSPK